VRRGAFDMPFLYEAEIALAERLGPRDSRIVDAVAHSAFLEHEIPSNGLRIDLRPYARLALAEFGPAAKPWAQQAVLQLSSDDAMGTGAAQIAVGAGESSSFRRVQELMQRILDETPATAPIPRTSRNRLYELAFALGMAGKDAEPYAGPMVELLNRQVESAAPPFGLISMPPARMCPVALRLGGMAAAATLKKPFCQRVPKAIEQ
jgi:hypothetical protein